jgi:hypothetical protein
MKITWHDAGREPQCAPNPAYPDGIDVVTPDARQLGVATCKVALPYPAKRCGHFYVVCETCGYSVVLTTAGRRDDPRTVEIACQAELATKQ